MEVKCRQCRVCAKENLESAIPDHLEKLLPEGYCHFICSCTPLDEGFKAILKLQLVTKEEAERWLVDFQRFSRVTLRLAKTYPNAEDRIRYNRYRVDMRCQHNTRSERETQKNTQCPAGLYLVLKKNIFDDNRKSRSKDGHIREGLLLHVTIKHNHNHLLDCAKALRHRDVSSETVEKLEKLFQSGHSPSSALKTLKHDLQEELGDSYALASADRSICPDVKFCYRLYNKIFKREYGAPSGVANCFMDLQVEEDDCGADPLNTSSQKEEAGETTPSSPQQSGAEQEAEPQLDVEHLECRLRSMFDDVMDKVKKDDSFKAPLDSFLSSYEKICSDSCLISAMSTFGKMRCAALSNTPKKPGRGLQMSTQIGVQPTAVARRKTPLGGRRSLIAGRPPKRARREKEGSGALPRGPAPHSLADCVSTGVSLGGHHSKK